MSNKHRGDDAQAEAAAAAAAAAGLGGHADTSGPAPFPGTDNDDQDRRTTGVRTAAGRYPNPESETGAIDNDHPHAATGIASSTSAGIGAITPQSAARTYNDTVAKAGFDPAHPEDFEADKPLDRAVLLGLGGRWLTDWALRITILLITGWLLSKVADWLWVGLLPILLALILSTVLWPPVKYMRQANIPAAIAALLSIVMGFGAVAAIIAAITPSIVEQAPQLLESASKGIQELQHWVQGPPLNIRDEQMNSVANEVVTVLQKRGDQIANGVFAGITRVGSLLVTLILVIVLTFFFIKDGVKFLPWLRRMVGRNAGRHLTEVLTRSWVTLSGFIRTQAIVSFVDGFFIGLGLIILGIPLAWALAIITFLAGFIPIVGAFTAGTLAVLVAFVSHGLTTALIVLAIVVVVQQLESHILQPVLQSRSMNLHPVVVLLAVAAGGGLYGIIGAFLAVPTAAVAAVVMRYIGEQIDLRTGDRSASDVKAATEEGKLTAWLGELGSNKFRKVPGLSGLAAAVTGGTSKNTDSAGSTRQSANGTTTGISVTDEATATPQPAATAQEGPRAKNFRARYGTSAVRGLLGRARTVIRRKS